MSSTGNCDEEKFLFVHRTANFDRILENLRKKGGTGSLAAGKAEEVINGISCGQGENMRQQFRFTRRGECRIKHCMKYDLGCGYRLVFIRRGCHFFFLYVGSHDDCFRWIERNKGLSYEIDDRTHALRIIRDVPVPGDECEEKLGKDEYEARLMSRIDDKVLRKVFSGFIEG
jgi:hypothetical protein